MTDDALLAGLDLARAEEWLPKRSDDLSYEVRDFLQRSIAAESARKEQQLRIQIQLQKLLLQRRMTVTAVTAAVLLAAVAIFAFTASREAIRERQRAQMALATTTQIATGLVFDLAQDRHLGSLPTEVRKQMLDRAIEAYNQTIMLSPTADAYNGRGVAYSDKGNLDHAIADFDKAIMLDPKNAFAYVSLGNAYRQG
jgi:tetratricopeptide (TPR) repeat protein